MQQPNEQTCINLLIIISQLKKKDKKTTNETKTIKAHSNNTNTNLFTIHTDLYHCIPHHSIILINPLIQLDTLNVHKAKAIINS